MLSNQTTNADLDELVLRRLLDRPIQRLLTASVRAALNIVISGESSSTNTMLDALRACIPVRERQERLVARDVRGARVLRLVRAMARGTGALATVRTTSADEALSTLTANTGSATPAAPLTSDAAIAGNAVDLIVHVERHRVGELATPVLLCRECGLATLASFEAEPAHSCGRFRHYPLSARLARRLNDSGQTIPAAFRDFS